MGGTRQKAAVAEQLSSDTVRRISRHIATLSDPDQPKSYRAECRLIRFGSKAVSQLIEAASSPDAQVRFRAVWALGKSRDPRSFETILRLTEDPDEAVAYDATLALAELGDARAVMPLQLLQGRNSGAPQMALTRLGQPVTPEE